jgi:hypothetical protein
MARKNKEICDKCLKMIDSISLELKSVELVEDNLSKLADKAIKAKGGFVSIDDIFLEIISTALYNSINSIKKIISE